MKQKFSIQMTIKYLLIAIILGGFFGNLCCILECLSAEPFMPDFEIVISLMALTLILLIYFLFIRKKKTVYALACIPSAMWIMNKTINFWGKIFQVYDKNEMKYIRLGTAVLFYFVLYVCIITILIILLIRWVLIKRGKLLDFEKIEGGYCVELNELLFICDRKDKNYKKQIRALADAYYQEKEKEMISYMIHQEAFKHIYGEMTEDEMLNEIMNMFFMPRIFLHVEGDGTVAFADESNVIEISFEGMFENLCDIIILSDYSDRELMKNQRFTGYI